MQHRFFCAICKTENILDKGEYIGRCSKCGAANSCFKGPKEYYDQNAEVGNFNIKR